MLPESADKVGTELNGTAIKSEVKTEVKEEPVEENRSTEMCTNNSSGPPSNKLTNGESENNNHAFDKAKVKEEKLPPQTLAEVLSEDTEDRRSSPAKAPPPLGPNKTPQPPKTSKSPIAAPPITSRGTPPASHMTPHPQQAPPTSGDSQFMQQQSQIFVFSTQMANDAAETVMAGQYKNILSFHMDQPNTKKFLQKHQMKIHPFAGNPGGMPPRNVRPSLMMKNQGGAGGQFPPSSSVEQWVQQQNAQLQEQYSFPPGMNSRSGSNPGMPQWQGGMMGEGFESMAMAGGLGPHHPSLSQQKVPNENLTPEQLKKRKDALQNLQKIQEMLFPEQHPQHFGPGQGPGPGIGGGMMQDGMPGGPMMQQNMMSPPHKRMNTQQSMPSHDMMPQQGMMGPDGMIGSPNNMMPMSQYGAGPSFMGPRGPGPQGMHNMSPAQHEWQRLQREFYMEKRQQGMAQRMGHPNMEMAGNGPPPPSYQHSIAQKRGSVSSTSPNCNGPLGSPPMVSQGVFDSHDMFSQGPRRSSFGSRSLEQGPTMMNPGMAPGGHFDPMMTNLPGSGAIAPGMPGPMHGRQQKSSRRSSSSELQRVGNPEPLLPDLVPSRPSSGTSVGNSVSKPPPSYAQHAQSQKRKRSEIEEDLYKNLQPTPSPQQINYLNQFEGQELTITKQLNSAYRDPNTPENHGPGNQFGSNPVAHSPMHLNSGTNKGPMSNSSQTSSVGPLNSPGPCPISVPGPNPLSGANMRLSHYDPPPVTNSIANSMSSTNVSSSAPPTPSNKSSLSNITSSSLADLAKGVEHLSNQMQQNMMQGGPFHSIQMQGQQATSNTSTSQSSTISSVSLTESQTNTTPSVNNTFVNATMSIQQLNIQSVNAGPGGQNYPNSQMNVQQMNMEQMGGMPTSASGPGHPNMTPSSVSMSQGQAMIGNPNMGQGDMGKMQQQQASVQMGNKMMMAQNQQSCRPGSPNIHSGNTMGNASVQIQSKTPNTIQYLPAHPPANQPNPPQKPPDLNFMQRFTSPMSNFDSKVPTSKVQYFPNPQDQVMRPGRMSPFAGGPQMGGMPPQHMMQRGGSAGPEFSSMGPGGPPMGGMNDMMMNNMGDSMGGPMGPSMGNMPPGMMPGPNEPGMMQGNMRMSPGMMAMDPMGPMSHPNSPPYDMGPEQMMGPGPSMMGGPMASRRPSRGFPPDMMPGGRGPASMEMMPGGSSAARLSAMSNFGPSIPPHGGQMPHGGMRMPGGPGMGMGGPQGGSVSYSAQYQQFQQQLYSQGRPRQMSPMEGMMGGPGPGGQYMGMMPNMPGP